MKTQTINDRDILEAALIGYNVQLARVELQMADIRSKLGGQAETAPTGRRPLSAKARASIARAQRTRWRKYHRQRGEAK